MADNEQDRLMAGWTLAGYGRVEDLSLQSSHLPPPPPGHMSVKIEAAALNPLDLKLIAGDLKAFMPLAFPFIPGSDICGRVVEVGDGVEGYGEDDCVVALTKAYGGLASHAVVPTGPTAVKVPPGLRASDVAALPEAGLTAIDVMRAADIQPGQTVAIVGATGGVGLFLTQLAAQAGARVIATATTDDEALLRSYGAVELINYAKAEPIAELQRLHPDGVDVLVDLIHQFDALLASVRSVRKGGRLVSTLVGPAPDQFPGGVEVRYVRLSPQPGDLERLVGALATGSLEASVSQVFSFDRVREALCALRDGHVTGKIAIEHT